MVGKIINFYNIYMEEIYQIKETLMIYSLEIYQLLQTFDFNIINNKKRNSSGDNVNRVDDQADIISEKVFSNNNLIYGFISEERENLVITNENGKYIITIDPLDGSQNINVGFNVGAIYGIYKCTDISKIKNGRDLIAAGYTVFSTSLQFNFTSSSVDFYRYNFKTQDWIIYKKDHHIPKKGKIYSINEGISEYFYEDFKKYINSLKGRSLRWMCCMVTDVHRNLMEGGCFIYPKNKKNENGKLRLIYELYPMAFIWEKSGGEAYIDLNKNKILDQVFPLSNLHKKEGGVFLGPYEDSLVIN